MEKLYPDFWCSECARGLQRIEDDSDESATDIWYDRETSKWHYKKIEDHRNIHEN